MASKMSSFRKAFVFPSKDVTHYFPGHMSKGLKQLQRRLLDVDCVLEVHDARIPLSGRNPLFQDNVILRPHILLLNKVDTADLSYRGSIEPVLRPQGVHNVMYVNCKEQAHASIKHKLMPKIMELIKTSDRFHRTGLEEYNLLVIGVPNVGKSSLINALRRNHCRKGKATRVGGVAGITRSVLERIKVSDHPRVYLYDSPGILHPNITDMESAMKLALCACLKDDHIGAYTIVDYLLYWLNKHRHFQYVSAYNLHEPTDDLHVLLGTICKQHGLVQKRWSPSGGNVLRPDFNQAARVVLKAFREGLLGKVNLDSDLLGKNLMESDTNVQWDYSS